jgi:signal transduction histidine kinase
MEESAEARIEALERLVSSLRHDLRGAITPAALIADRLRQNSDPAIQRSAARIAQVVERVMSRLTATYELVPPRDGTGPVIGTGGRLG